MPAHSNTAKFTERSRKIQNNKYGYTRTIYKNNATKVIISCDAHGDFLQSPKAHLKGSGCPKCSNNNFKYTTEQFADKAHIKHNHKFDYSLSVYNGAHINVIIICDDHGKFEQSPHSHLSGRGCPKCANTRHYLLSNIDEFTQSATLIHSSKYNYSNFVYTDAKTKSIIICSDHGEFLKSPNHHLSGQGCPSCQYRQKELSWINSFGNPNIQLNYILTILGKTYKPDGIDLTTNTIYEFYGDYWHGNPNKFDPDSINKSNGKTFSELYQATIHREMELLYAGYDLITIWEEDFDKNI